MEYINMDKRFKISKILVRNLIFLLLFALLIDRGTTFGYDSTSSSCSPNTKQSRRGRAQMLAAIPCDLITQAYCTQPGAAYPWHAVRRFVHENQGLMKRMYGDVRHIAVLRDEILNNEIDVDDIEAAAERYSRDGYNRRASKLMHHRDDFENFKMNDVLREPHFRPVTTTTSTSSTSTTTTTTQPPTASTTVEDVESTVVANDIEQTTIDPINDVDTSTMSTTNGDEKNEELPIELKKNIATENFTTKSSSSDLLEKQVAIDDDGDLTLTPDDDDLVDIINIELNSVFESSSNAKSPSELDGSNIEVVQSPQLGVGNTTTENLSISSTSSKLETTTTITTVPSTSSLVDTNSSTTTTTMTTTSTTTTSATSTTLKPETTAERSPAKQQRKPFVPSSSTKHHRQRPQQLQKVESTISAKLKLKINPTQATPPRTTTISTPVPKNNTNTSSTSSTITTPLTSTKTSPFKSHLNKNYNRYTTTNNKYNVPSTGPSAAPSAQTPLKPNSDLLLGEKIRKPVSNVTPAAAAVANKPIMRDGQLFQDTMKQEPAPIVNVRGVNACPVKEEVVAPFWANNTRGEVLALLNLYPFEQYVHWEKCTHEHKQMYCREGCRCEQQYRLHRLLAYDPHNECRGIFSDWFRFPSCCICKCYNIPLDFRATSRSPRSEGGSGGGETSDRRHPIEIAEEQVKNAIYEHATEDWYRPKDEFDFFEG
ncbi:spaetzle domain-containing protein 4 [Haematobia irritans]|uniref:spaetzle domain-containing protein 4 n=1 Tax=Haematobia irritans TaxID=7368 RepID=UPI003F509A35